MRFLLLLWRFIAPSHSGAGARPPAASSILEGVSLWPDSAPTRWDGDGGRVPDLQDPDHGPEGQSDSPHFRLWDPKGEQTQVSVSGGRATAVKPTDTVGLTAVTCKWRGVLKFQSLFIFVFFPSVLSTCPFLHDQVKLLLLISFGARLDTENPCSFQPAGTELLSRQSLCGSNRVRFFLLVCLFSVQNSVRRKMSTHL